MQAVIMAGGNGIRLYPYTSVLPKPLLPINEVPIIELIVRQLRHHGFTRVSIASGYLAELIKLFLGDGSKYGLRIEYSIETKPLGTIAPLTLFRELEPTVLVMNADLLTSLDYRTFMDFHRRRQAAVTIGMCRKTIPTGLGVLETDGDYRLKQYHEKPEIKINVSMGIYAFESRVLVHLPKKQPVDFPDFINLLIQSGERVVGYPFEGYWLDIGQHCDYERAVREFNQIRGELNID
jgi:NDP-sugar pyrophosphorylase family protein